MNDSRQVLEHTWFLLLLLEQCANYHCRDSRLQVKNVVDIVSLIIPLQFCSFLHFRPKLLQPFVVERTKLLHIATFVF